MAVAEGLPALRGAVGSLSVTVYNQHTFTSVNVGPTGHVHSRASSDPDDQTPTAVECGACEPFLVREGWVHDPGSVPLTDRQEREREQVEREGNLAVKQVAESLAAAAANAIVQASPDAAKAARPRPRSKASR